MTDCTSPYPGPDAPVTPSGADPPVAGAARVVTCDLALAVTEPAEVVLQVEASRSAGRVADRRLEIATAGGPDPDVAELDGPDGGRLQVLRAGRGRLTVSYRAVIEPGRPPPPSGAGTAVAPPSPAGSAFERQLYLRPSRYCPSDHLVGFAVAEFGTEPDTAARVAAITAWIRRRVGYVPGSSSVHDSAEHTLLTGMGTCRDFAHLGVALCRATGVPARFAAVYAPGLSPMDFHAVFETFEAGRWHVHDATGLAPRPSLVRIATGRDAADVAFVAVTTGLADLDAVEVTATVDGGLPADDHAGPVELA